MTNLNHTMALLPRLHEVSNIKQGSKKIKNADLNRLGKSGFVITCNISCNGWPYKHCKVKSRHIDDDFYNSVQTKAEKQHLKYTEYVGNTNLKEKK